MVHGVRVHFVWDKSTCKETFFTAATGPDWSEAAVQQKKRTILYCACALTFHSWLENLVTKRLITKII